MNNDRIPFTSTISNELNMTIKQYLANTGYSLSSLVNNALLLFMLEHKDPSAVKYNQYVNQNKTSLSCNLPVSTYELLHVYLDSSKARISHVLNCALTEYMRRYNRCVFNATEAKRKLKDRLDVRNFQDNENEYIS